MVKQICPTCGKEFQRLGQHNCPNAVAGRPDSATSNKRSTAKSEKKQPCPTCGREFERLCQHRCPAASSQSSADSGDLRHSAASPANVRSRGNSSAKAADESTKRKQPCASCGDEFERLWQHRCRATTSGPSGGTTSHGKAPGITEITSTKEKQPCPSCGVEFERLWQHRCRAATSGPSGGTTSCGKAPGTTETTNVKEAATGKSARSPCTDEGCPSGLSRQHTGSSHRGARTKVKCAPLAGSCLPGVDIPQGGHGPSEGQQVCGQCGKDFKRVSQHRCKTVSVPPPSPHSSPASAEPSDAFVLTPDQDSRGYVPVIDTKALKEEAQKVRDHLHLQASSDPRGEAIGFFYDEIIVKKEESRNVSDAFNPFRNKILEWLQDSTECPKWGALSSGSNYDGTKVTRADEVDCMFYPQLPTDWLRISCEGAPPGFCYVEMTSAIARDDPCGLFLQSLCPGGNRISSQLFREKAFDAFRKAVEDKRRARADPDTKPGAASFPVLLDAFPRTSRDEGKGHRPVSIDLVPALKMEGFPSGSDGNLFHLAPQDVESIKKAGFHVIPKECPHRGYEKVRHLLWRLSFSQAEKTLTKHADGKMRAAMGHDLQDARAPPPPTCRKFVLRMLKRFLEIFKGMDNSRTSNPKMQQLQKAANFLKERGRYQDLKIEKFSTFQIRTLMWTEFYVTRHGDDLWKTKDCRRPRLIHSLDQLKKMVSGRMRVSHFFIPHLDIMAEVPELEREFLYIIVSIATKIF